MRGIELISQEAQNEEEQDGCAARKRIESDGLIFNAGLGDIRLEFA